jgi:hypothetical protein
MSAEAEDLWHVRVAPDEVKILTLEQVDDLFRLEVIDEDTQLWQEGMDEWLPLRVIAGLDDEPAPSLPPISNPPPRSPALAQTAPWPPPPAPAAAARDPAAAAFGPPRGSRCFVVSLADYGHPADLELSGADWFDASQAVAAAATRFHSGAGRDAQRRAGADRFDASQAVATAATRFDPRAGVACVDATQRGVVHAERTRSSYGRTVHAARACEPC